METTRKKGAQRMTEQGYRQVVLWLTEPEWELMRRVAKIVRKPISTMCREELFSALATPEDRARNRSYRK